MMRDAHVLVVEDEPLSRDVLVRMLQSRGLEVDSVGDGAACLAWLEDRLPDLVLLDVSMPGMSGLDALQVIRGKHSQDQLPVILVTAMVDPEDIVAGLEAGANDYVVKPVNLPVLLARIDVALRAKRGVSRLVEAERHRVMLASLDDTCEQLAAPMKEVIGRLEELVGDLPPDDERQLPHLRTTLDWANRVADLIERFRRIARYQTVPYTEGLGSFVAASLETAARPEAEPHERRRPVEPDL
jgi:CheY-like chemotaxis protein